MKWLDANGSIYRFHDLRADGLDRDMLERWTESAGWEALLNRRSTTWRGLADSAKDGLNEERAIELMLEYPTLIKRPIAESGHRVLVGFSAATYEALTRILAGLGRKTFNVVLLPLRRSQPMRPVM